MPRPPKKLPKPIPKNPAVAAVEARFTQVIDAFVLAPQVTHGGKGFGSSGLKVSGKLFAMISSQGKFVAKLPRERVDELVADGEGEAFDPGQGRLMKEWIALHAGSSTARWIELAREAHEFVKRENA